MAAPTITRSAPAPPPPAAPAVPVTPARPGRNTPRPVSPHRHGVDDGGLTRSERPLFEHHLCPGMDILDLGVGTGRTTTYLSQLAGRYVGIDRAEPLVEECRDRFPGVELHHAAASDLSFLDDRSFDAVVFSSNGIDHVSPADDRLRCLAECHRLLRRGGVLILSRHNPRAIVDRPALGGASWRRKAHLGAAMPVRGLQRAVRVVPSRTFWTGAGTVIESPPGPTTPQGPQAPHVRRRAAEDRPGTVTHMAVPRIACTELRRAGFTVTAVTGGLDPNRTGILSTPYYHYVATKLSHLARMR